MSILKARSRHLEIGAGGETLAVKLLRKRNCTILASNWRNSNEHDGSGEMDIVAVDGETVIFVEVKTRRKLDNYLPGANLSDSQKKRIRRGANIYCRQHNIPQKIAKRFDYIEVIYDGKRLHDIALHENYMPFTASDFLT